jgi:hypothetical protein
MRFFNAPPGGNDNYNAPDDIRRLPFDLWRSQLYPRRPALVAQAAQEYLDGTQPPAAYLPQRMGFTRWKTPPYEVGWGQNVAALLDALAANVAVQQQAYSAAMSHVPRQTAREAVAAIGADRLPEPSDNLDPNLDAAPLARNALPLDRVVTAQDMNALVRETRSAVESANNVRYERRERAMSAVSQQRSFVDGLLSDRSHHPWFLQRG